MLSLIKREGRDLFNDDLFENFFNPVLRPTASVMKTDIKKVGSDYVLDIDLPGFKKEDIKITLKDEYLTIEATKVRETEDNDEKTKYLRKERYFGTCSRSFYVGEITQEEIQAKYEDGILTVTIPDVNEKPEKQPKMISIK